MTHELKFCELCGFTDDGTVKANALSVYGRCPFCEQAYRRGREDAAIAVRDRGFALWSHRPDERRMSAGVLPALMAAARGETQ